MDQSVLDVLPLAQRQKVTRQLRQKQVEHYLDFLRTEAANQVAASRKVRKANKKNTTAHFKEEFLLQDAVENFDDKQVMKLLKKGINSNFQTGNDTSLLHKCAVEDNVMTAELLLKQGADINILDSDWWTPLHVACSCDSLEMVHLLLNNGADVSMKDVDGFFPVDIAPEGSDSHQAILAQMQALGIGQKEQKEMKLSSPRQMFKDIQEHIETGGNVNKCSNEGISLLHIACANGYRKVIRLLIKHGADVNSVQNEGWTPLHVAAKFNQMKTVQTLLKNGADPSLKDNLGCPASVLATADNIKVLLMKAERKQQKNVPWRESELPDQEDEEDGDEEEDKNSVCLVRINSKTVRSRMHTSLAKEDEILEAKKRFSYTDRKDTREESEKENVYDELLLEDAKQLEEEEMYQEIYISKIWQNVDVASAMLPAVEVLDDLSNIPDISEDAVLQALEQRYLKNQIYTTIGDILITVNPFTSLGLYSKVISSKYHTKSSVSLPPHIYGTAERAHRCLVREQASQCCVISGESGSGKTESCKLLIQHLVAVAGSEESNLNHKISQANPVLEAFGNAKTVMNNNSSRFAKYMELKFNTKGRITGAHLTEYLLEKSRIVFQGEGEYNFHVFYWLFSGLTYEEAEMFHLKSINNHRYLRSNTTELKSLISSANKEKFWELKECLKFIGFSQSDVHNIFLLLAALVHMGDITFCSSGNNDAAVITSVEKVECVSAMLELSSEELSAALTSEYTVTRGEPIRKERTVMQANDCRDASAKTIYSRLFSWIVNGINQMIQPIDPSSDNYQIGILDIFGFENFSRNSFEQMCINLANEQMQNYTNEFIFQKEQLDCLSEGVPVINLKYENNLTVLDLFQNKTFGILVMLDEESRFPKGTDNSLATKLHQSAGKKYADVYKTPKDGGKTFTVIHYAGAVKYDLTGVLEKNRDTLPNAIMYTMKTSNSLLIKEMFQSRVTRTGSIAPSSRQQRSRRQTANKSPFDFFKKLKGAGKTKKAAKPTVSTERKGPATMAFHFKNSLADLMMKIQSSKPHIVRCLRPNNTKTPQVFNSQYVLAQIRYTGITETIKIKKYGYSMRMKFHDFIVAYKSLYACVLPAHCMLPEGEKCERIMKYCKLSSEGNGYKMGRTKMFLRDKELETLDNASKQMKARVIKAQAVVRGYLNRCKVKRMRQQLNSEQEQIVQDTSTHLINFQSQIYKWLQEQYNHDKERYQMKQKEEMLDDICKSLDKLDAILDENTNTPGKKSDEDNEDVQYADVANLITDLQTNHEETEYADVANVRSNMNSHVQYRGLPPPPCGAYIPVGDQTPLSTPDLYSHTGIYDVIPAQENEVSRKAPAPPRRSPSTKLSTSSNASDDVIHSTPYHPYGPQQPGSSPRNQRKHSAQVSPPHNVAKPFSYAPPSPSDLRRASEPIQYVPNERSSNSPKYDVPSFHGGPMYEAVPSSHYSSMMAHESQGYYNPARVHSPSHLSQSPGSPKLHRQSSGSPRLARKNSDRNRLIPVEAVSPPVVDKPHGQSGHGPPSFPAPPPPLPTAAKFIAAMTQKSRSPSPPLPPPPPELIDSSGKIMSPQASLRQRAMQSTLQINTSPQPVTEEPPTPPPISKIPGTRSSVSSFEIGKKIHRGDSREASPIPSPTHSSQSIGLAAELSKVKLRTAVVSSNNRSNVTPTSDVNKNFKKDTMGIIAELGQVQLRSVSSPVDSEGEIHNKTDGTENPAVGRVRLNAVKDTGQHGTVIKDTSSGELILPKLRPTGGQKPWEKDISPSSQCSDLSPCGDLPLPPPPPELMEVPPARLMEASHQEFLKPVQPSIDTNSKPITDKYNAPVKKGIKQNRNKESSNHSSMDINLDEIDYSQIPGYVEITAAVPNWKRDMIEKKNKEKLDEYIAMVRRKKEEAEKWKDVPEWKRKLLEEKEREKREKEAEMTQASKTGNKPKSKIHVEERELFVTPSSSHKTPITPPMTSISQQHEPSSLTSNSADDLDLQHVSESSNTNQCHHIETEFYKIERGNAFQKEEEERRRAQKQKQIELAAQMEQEMANVPAWKREIMMKKGGNAPSNWGDEREEINRDDD